MADILRRWLEEHPEDVGRAFEYICAERDFNFEFAKRCKDCPYYDAEDEDCDHVTLAEELRGLL